MELDIKSSMTMLEMTPRQLVIYNGLKDIGEEIAAFYSDGVRVFNDRNLRIKPYLLAHISREIECGLRDIWSLKEDSNEKCSKCGNPEKRKSHINSICEALDLKKENPLVKGWHKVAKEFHKYAHRHGAWKSPRDQHEFDKLWEEFEKILYSLLANYLNLLDRIDRVLKFESPSREVIKSLPNLLKMESRYFYFFKNLESPEWLKPLKDVGFFDPDKNPNPIEAEDDSGGFSFPQWGALYYLETIAKSNAERRDERITATLVEIIDKIIENKNDNFFTNEKIVEIISFLPIDKIKVDHIQFVGSALRSDRITFGIPGALERALFPHLIKHNAKELINELINTALNYRRVTETRNTDLVPILERERFERLIQRHKKDIAKICGLEALEIGIMKMNQLNDIDDRQFKKMHMYTLDEHFMNSSVEKYNFQLVSFVRAMLEELPPHLTKNTVIEMIKNEESIFKRLALYAIKHHYKELNEIFWALKENPLDVRDLKQEVSELLNSNFSSFTQMQIEMVRDWIESEDYYTLDEGRDIKSQKAEALAYRKKEWEWLTALINSHNEDVKRKYEEYNYDNANKDRPIPPGHDFWVEVGCGVESPIPAGEMLNMDNADIVDYLNNFQEEYSSPILLSKDGLADELKKAVKQQPLKFSENLEPFINLQKEYLYDLLLGFQEAWRQKMEIAEGKVLEFILKLIKDENFWIKTVTNRLGTNSPFTISGVIAGLLEAGTQKDEHAFNEVHLEKTEDILLILLDKTPSELKEQGDIGSITANSPKGKITSALINYSLRFARVNKLKHNRWKENIKLEFTHRLDGTYDHAFEYYANLGTYLPYLYYLDENWVKENILKIFSQRDDSDWEAATTGYFLFSNVYQDVYELLKYHGIVDKALNWEFKDAEVLASLIKQICIAYANGWENIEDQNSLIYKAIAKKDKIIFDEIIRFFRFLAENDDRKDFLKPKIRPLWRYLIYSLESNLKTPEFQYAAAKLWRFIYYFDDLDDELFEWLKLSVSYFGKYNHGYEFVTYLSGLLERYPEKVGELYIDMLKSGAAPDSPDEDIKKIIEVLYYLGNKNIADEICNLYGSAGKENVVRQIYNAYQSGGITNETN